MYFAEFAFNSFRLLWLIPVALRKTKIIYNRVLATSDISSLMLSLTFFLSSWDRGGSLGMPAFRRGYLWLPCKLYSFWFFWITEYLYSHFENSILLPPLLEGVTAISHFVSGHDWLSLIESAIFSFCHFPCIQNVLFSNLLYSCFIHYQASLDVLTQWHISVAMATVCLQQGQGHILQLPADQLLQMFSLSH